jgi:ribonuclease P protein subunit POP4
MRLSKGELIGKTLEVIESNNKSLKGLKGVVINETKNTITIKGEKTILKRGCTFRIENEELKGEDLRKRPEERIKG